MRHRRYARRAWPCLLAALVGLPLAVAAADGWQPRLAPPQGEHEYRTPRGTLRIYIPPEVSRQTLANLALELDGIDLTDMVRREGDYALFTPPQPLDWGEHRLRIVEYRPDGAIVERGAWTFEVRKSALLREASLQAQGSVTASRRIAEEDASGGDGHQRGDLRLVGRVADDGWRAGADVPLIYGSNGLGTGRKLDMGDFRITGEAGDWSATAGHHTVRARQEQGAREPNALVVDPGFSRRGLSATHSGWGGRSAVTGFSMRMTPVTGFEDGIGVEDEDDRVDGLWWSLTPWSGEGRGVEVSAIYASGEGPEA